ncbi:Ig-like domain-containing protein [Citrobacter amalonaticus]|uniref:Ig-like domain-containing protein n=1 Tax=Citrobacter amalonaticus TaxID=35703 RepID=UPI001788D5CC|nr:Ig-like domain-containing protein [Citrobacter amalonaticus]HED1254299.1 Ig-like domain-containing protein [Citrobacter amalonaticus]
MQFFLPLMLAFTPAVRAAQAKWYQTPPEQQTVSVSASELPTLGGDPAADEKSGNGNDNATEARTAQLASKTGQFLNNASGDAAAGIARQMATGKASAEIEQWLNRVGTARVQMQLDEEFSLKNSSVDLLIPWYDSPEALVFSQHSLHRTDDRTQGNLGAGYRYYTPDWMAGVNAFYDYDFSGEHSRMGMGLEYGRDYLKLAANGYFRLSGWKNASDLADYEARPANGWDIRSEGYLPVYPQLGGKLVYEQYYGKEVGLFGRDNRQQDPRAVTAGLSYTPFPLMTLSADHRMGEGGENDTRLGVEFSWQFDTPLHKLLDTDAVGQMRTLAGSRYHLVDRNNNIVLEYREKNNLTLKMAEALRGYQGDRLSLDVVVNARHGLERIVWDDSTLRAAGGEVTCTANTQCVVTLPLWKTGGIDANTYVISAVAHDKAGNHSPQASTHIFVEQSAVNADNSTFEIVPTHDPNARAAVIEADGVTTATMTFRALDGQSLPISSLNPEILQHESSLGGLTISSVREVSAGVYVATVSGNTAGEAWMAPVVNGSALSSLRKPVTFVTSAISVNFIVVTDNAIADGVLPNSVKATLTDDEGNPLADKVVNFSVDNGATIAASGTTGPDGSVIMTLTSTVAGAATVTASINGNSESVNVTFTADAGSAHIADGALERVTNDAVANGSATNSVKATVTDANGNPLSGQTVNFSADNGATIAASGTTGDDGTVTMTLTSTVAGDSTVTASINGSSQSVSVTFVADTSTARIADGALERVTNDALANGSATNSVKATVTDANGNPLSGQVVNFSAGNGATILASGTTSADGTVTMTLTSTVAGDATVTASINSSSQSVSVTFTADTGTARIAAGALERVTNDALANGSATNSVKATVTDAQGNLLSGQVVNFSADNGATMVASGTTGDDGTVTMTLTSTVAGDSTVTASINSSSQSVSVTFTADTGTARIADGALSVVYTGALANGSATNSVKATVTDANRNPLSGQVVNFSADNGATIVASGTTGDDGTVTMTLTSTVAGDSTVTASINGSSQSVSVTFTADTSTARIAEGALSVVYTGALADGSATNSVKATVTDANRNPLSGQVVNFSAGNGATILASGTTGDDGTVTMMLTSTVAGNSTVTASINNSSQSVSVTFVADTSTARIADGALERVTNDALANGSATNSVKATVTDANRNPLSGQVVNFSAGNGATIVASGTTGDDGTVTMTLTSTVAGDSTVTASINNSNQSVSVTFIADTSTARIADGALAVEFTGALANGSATNKVKATVTDANGNILIGQTVNFSAGNGASIVASGTTGNDGTVTMTLTSTVVGDSTVTASINNSSESVDVTFVADTGTAQIADGALEIVETGARADGETTNSVKATVTDARGTPLPDQIVTFSADNGATIAASGTTGGNGTVTMMLTSRVAGDSTVTASINGSSQSVRVTFVADENSAQMSVTVDSADAVPANGSATRTVTATLTDASNNPLRNQPVSFTVNGGPAFTGEASGTTGDDGTMAVTLTSTVAGTFTVSGTASGLSLSNSAEVAFIADTSTAQLIIGTSSDTKTANGTDTHPVILRVEDAQGNPLTSVQSVTLSVPADGPRFSNNSATLSTSTDSNGELEVPLTSTVAGTFTVSARMGSGTAVTAQVRFAADTSTARLAVAAGSTEAVPANGTATRTVTATLTDAGGNPLPNQSVLFTAGDGPVFSGESSGTTGDDGTVTVTLTSTVAGTFTVSGAALSLSLNDSAEVTFIADASTAQLIIGTSSDTKTANGTDTHPVTLRVEDAQGNPLTSIQSVTLSVPADGPLFSNNTATLSTSTDSNGELEVPLTSTVAGTFTVSARLGSGTAVTAQVRFAADTSTARLTVAADSTEAASANGTATRTVTATLTDAGGNALPNQPVSFTVNGGPAFSGESSGTTGDHGTMTVTLTSTVAGTFTVSGTAARLSLNGSAQVMFAADASTARLVIETSSDTTVANGTDSHPVTLKVEDAQGNPLTSVHNVTLSVPANGALFSNNSATLSTSTDSNGELEVPLTSTVAGTFTVSASLGDSAAVTAQVTFVADVSTARLVIETSSDATTANGTDSHLVTLKVKDAQGNALNGVHAVSLDVPAAGPLFSNGGMSLSSNTESNGELEVPLTSTMAGTFTVSARLGNGTPVTAQVTFAADLSTARLIIETSADTRTATGTDPHPVTLKVVDAQNNPLAGVHAVTLSVPADGPLFSNNTATLSTSTESNGELEVPLTSTVVGTFTVSARLGSGAAVSADVTFVRYEVYTATISLSPETDGTDLHREVSIAADGTAQTRVVVVIKDQDQRPATGLTGLKIKADQSLLKDVTGGVMTAGTEYDLVASSTDGVYYKTVVAGTDTGSVRFSITAGLTENDISITSNSVTVNLTAGEPSDAGVYLSSERDGTNLASTTSLAANGSDETRIVIVVKDANGHGVTGLEDSLRIKADTGGLLSTVAGTEIAEETEYGNIAAGTVAGVYYLTVKAGTTLGTVKFRVTGGLSNNLIPPELNSVTVNLTAGIQSVAGIYLSSETDGTALERAKSLVADGNSRSYTRIVVTVKDANGHGINDVAPQITALSGSGLLKNAAGVSITEGTAFNMARGTADGVYYLSVWAQTTSGTVKFSVTGGLNDGVIPAGQNTVTVNLTAGDPSVAGIYLSSETDGTALAESQSLVANGSSYTRVVVKVEDANGNGVNDLSLKIAAQSGGGLLRNANNVSMAEGTDFDMVRGTADGVYYLSVWAGTTSGTVTFSVTDGLNPGVLPTGSNTVTVNLTAGAPSVAGIYLSSEADGTELERTASLVAVANSNYTRVVVTVKDANGNGVDGLQNLKIAAQSGGGLLTSGGVSMTQGTDFNLIAGEAEGVYYLNVWSGNTTGTVTFSVTGGLNPGVIPTGNNNVTVNLTAGDPSVAGIYLSSEMDGTSLAQTTSLVANGSSYTRVVVTVKDANGNGVNGLQNLKIAAQSGSGLLTSGGVSMTQGTNFNMISGGADGVYYLNVWSRTTTGAVKFSVTGGLDTGLIPTGSNNVTVNLTAGAPSVAGIYLSSEMDGTALASTKSLVANGSSYTRVVVTVKDVNGNGVDGLPLKIAAQSGGGLLTSGNVAMTQGTNFDMIAGGTKGVYYLNVWSRTTTGAVKFSVTGGLNPGVIPTGSNTVTVNLTAGDPSVAGIYLSSKTDGTDLAGTKSLDAVVSSSNWTRVVVTVKDANGNGVNGLTLKIAAQSGGGLLRNYTGAAMPQDTAYTMSPGTADGVYYLSVWAGATAGTVKFSVTSGLNVGVIPTGSNNVTVTLTVPPPASAQINAWWSYQGGSNRGSTYRTFGSAVRFLNSSGTPMQCDSVTVVGTSGVGYRAEASSVRDLYSYSADKWNNSTSDNEGSNSFNSSTKVYTFTKYSHIGVTGKQGVTYSGVLAASGYMTYPINGQGYLGGDDRITVSCKVGSTTYSFKSSNGMTVNSSLGI